MSDSNDTITGTNKNDVIYAGDGADYVDAGNGNDIVDGGTGGDTLLGGNGNDILYGGEGNDILSGGNGQDIVYGGSGNDLIGSAALLSSENGSDVIFGDGRESKDPTALAAIAGDDTIFGGNSADIVYGDNGDSSSVGGNDTIITGNGNDSIYGEGGNDIITGGNGADVITGGAGNDTFVYNSATESNAGGMDVIKDFSGITDSNLDNDKIDLRPLLGPTDLKWGGMTETANGVWFTQDVAATYVKADTNGDSVEDLVIKLDGIKNLTNNDFLGVLNAGPTISLPANASMSEDTDLVLSTSNGNAIQVADADFGAVLTVTLTASHGSLSLSNTAGLSVIDGTGNDGTLTLSGSAAALNAALGAGLTFTPTGNYNGPAQIEVQTTDGLQAATSTLAISIANVNDAPAGGVIISGTAAEDQVLTASNTLSDEDGLGTITYTWLADGVSTGVSGATYTLGQADVGKAFTVQASYTDDQGTPESVTSDATAAVANVDDAAIGTLAVTGTAAEGGSLVAALTATDADGGMTTAYQWQVNIGNVWTDISGKTSATLAIPDDQSYVGKEVRAVATTTDTFGGHTTFEGTGQTIANVNDNPVANADIFWVSNSTVVTMSLSTLLGNDTDVDGLAVRITSFGAATGQFTSNPVLNGDGTFSFTTDATGGTTVAPTVRTFTYDIVDGLGGSHTGVVTVNVIATSTSADTTISLAGVGSYQGAYIDLKAGNDVFTDGAGISVLIGGANNDTLNGGDGNDILRGGANNDTLNGGNGIDLLDFSDATGGITLTLVQSTSSTSINFATEGLGNDSYTNMEGIIGSAAYADTLTGSSGDDVLRGMGGADTLSGAGGNDILRGGTGNDTIDGGAGLDLLDFSDATAAINFTLVQSTSNTTVGSGATPGLGQDTYKNMEGVIGSSFNDTLVGSSSDDILVGGSGADTMTGGLGADTFRFTLSDASAVDTVTDFDATANSDKLDLRDLLVGEHANAESLDSYLDFSYDAASNSTTVNVMSQGAGVVDHQIQLQGFNASLLGSDDNAIITEMLARGKLVTEA